MNRQAVGRAEGVKTRTLLFSCQNKDGVKAWKKQDNYSFRGNCYLFNVSSINIGETADITAKKKIKDLTFHFCYVRKKGWTMKTNNIKGNGDINVIF